MSNDTFTEYRKDGWPLCPRCGEDELYSLFLMSMHAHIRQEGGEQIQVDEVLRYPFRCYKCNWSNDQGMWIGMNARG